MKQGKQIRNKNNRITKIEWSERKKGRQKQGSNKTKKITSEKDLYNLYNCKSYAFFLFRQTKSKR